MSGDGKKCDVCGVTDRPLVRTFAGQFLCGGCARQPSPIRLTLVGK